MTKVRQMQNIIHQYRRETGEVEVDMHKVADYAIRKGWPLPTPANPRDQLAAAFSQAARVEIRHDSKTGRPYRANHAFSVKQGDMQLFLWVDIDEATRTQMQRSIINRREQIVGDVVQLTFDAEHWNSIHPEEEPIVVPADFSDDVEWRKNGPEEASA